MTKDEAIKMIENDIRIHHDYLSGKYRQALTMAIEALQRTSNTSLTHECVKPTHECVEPVGNSDTLRPKGKWSYEKINSYSERTYCSECGSHAPFEYVTDDHYGRHAHGEIRKTNFCPNCGADMRGEQNE